MDVLVVKKYQFFLGLRALGCLLFGSLVPVAGASSQQSPQHAAPGGSGAHESVRWGDKAGEAEFHIVGDTAVITLRLPSNEVLLVRRIENPDDALAVLADQRLRFSWEAVLRWAGSDLVVLRDKALLRARAAADVGLPNGDPRGPAEETSGALQASILQYARILTQSGHRKEAINTLNRQLSLTTATADSKYDRMMLVIKLASILFEGGDTSQAIEVLDKQVKDATTLPDARLNYQVALAQYLARSGSYNRALEIITNASAQFSVSTPQDSESVKVPGSDAQFSWIRACALNGVGREAESRTIMASLDTASHPVDLSPLIRQVRLNAFLCMKDHKQLSAELSNLIATEPPASELFQFIQPGNRSYLPERAVLAMALKNPMILNATSGHVRFLDGPLTPAVREWRDE